MLQSLLTGGKMNYAIIIAIEEYLDSRISNVDFAENDARDFAASLKNISYLERDVQILVNGQATKTTLESKIRMLALTLCQEDNLIIYYSGHGFANCGKNFITCYDSVSDDLDQTSISIQSIFEVLRTKCNRIMYFFDSCHSGLIIDKSMRGLYTDLSKAEYLKLQDNMQCCIGFAACKSDELSYPIPIFKHGAWTYHLIEALNGMADEALEKNGLITALSLQTYLRRAVPLSLKRAYTTPRKQTPWLFGGLEVDIVLGDLSAVLKRRKAPLPSIKDISLLIRKVGVIKSLSGFQKNSHTVPKCKSHATEQFVLAISKEERENEISRLQGVITKGLGFKRKDVSISEGIGVFSILTPAFVATFTFQQSEEDYKAYEYSVCLNEFSDKTILAQETFNSVFSGWFDTLVLHLDREIDVAKLIDSIEENESTGQIEINYPLDAAYCDIRAKNINGYARVNPDEITIELNKADTPKNLLATLFHINNILLSLSVYPLLLEKEETTTRNLES